MEIVEIGALLKELDGYLSLAILIWFTYRNSKQLDKKNGHIRELREKSIQMMKDTAREERIAHDKLESKLDSIIKELERSNYEKNK